MWGWVGKLLLSAGSKLAPKTAVDMLKKVGIQNMDDLAKFSKKEILDKLGLTTKPGLTKKIIGGATTAGGIGLGAYGGSRWEKAKKLDKAKGGSVRKMKAGGSVSRGTGAAIKGTKFKGVF